MYSVYVLWASLPVSPILNFKKNLGLGLGLWLVLGLGLGLWEYILVTLRSAVLNFRTNALSVLE